MRVSPRLRGLSLLSEWEIIERDYVLVVLCRRRYCKEMREKKKKGETSATMSLLCYVASTVKRKKETNETRSSLYCVASTVRRKKGKKSYWYSSMGRGVRSSRRDDFVLF